MDVNEYFDLATGFRKTWQYMFLKSISECVKIAYWIWRHKTYLLMRKKHDL